MLTFSCILLPSVAFCSLQLLTSKLIMTESKEINKKEAATGRYVYDKKLGKVVKVSDEIPGLKKGPAASDGACPINPGGHKCGGCCGH